MLLLSPNYLFIYPGLVLFLIGFIGQSVLLVGTVTVAHHALQVHFSILFSLLTLAGSQAVIFGVFARTYAKSIGLEKPDALSEWVERDFSLERGLLVGALFVFGGLGIDIGILVEWLNRSLGTLDAVRPAIYALTLLVLGLQLIFAAFFLSLFQVKTHVIPMRGVPTAVDERNPPLSEPYIILD
jgi:hypothetical protein